MVKKYLRINKLMHTNFLFSSVKWGIVEKGKNNWRLLVIEGMAVLSAQYRTYSRASELVAGDWLLEDVDRRAQAGMVLYLLKKLQDSVRSGEVFNWPWSKN